MLGFVSPCSGHGTMRLRGTGRSTRSARSISMIVERRHWVVAAASFFFSAGAGGGNGLTIAGLGGMAIAGGGNG
jgi:hypothetical protein